MTQVKFAPDGFKVIRRIGVGGTANVYLATEINSNRRYALKTPLDDNNRSLNEFSGLIRREYDLIGRLNYPGLVRIYGIGEDKNKRPFLIMEYCPSVSLDQTGRPETTEVLLNILSSLSANFLYLRLAGIYHGDIKPQNIFLAGNPNDYDGNKLLYTKLSDFSLALKSDEDEKKRLGVGTIGYSAPETIEHDILNHRSDIFSLGVIAYLLATGRHPFMHDETDPVRVSSLVKEHIPPAPCEINYALGGDLSDLIMTMLEKSPEKRPSDSYTICKKLEDSGARYPFRKAIRPKHLLEIINGDASSVLQNDVFAFPDETAEILLEYGGEDRNALRNILEINFTRGVLSWSGGRLKFNCPDKEIVYPKKLSRNVKKYFFGLGHSHKKEAILAAIVGNITDAEVIFNGMNLSVDRKIVTRPIIGFLSKNLSRPTVNRFANKLAEIAKNKLNRNVLASKLYLKADNPGKALTVTLDAVNELINNNDYDSAFDLLSQLKNLCRKVHDIENLKIVLMRIGDLQRLTGNAARAEETYKNIVDLYDNQSPDRLLGETYKDLGDLYKMKQQYDDGISALRKAEKIYAAMGDDLELSHTLNNIGNIQTIISQYDEAVSNYRRALKIQRKLEIDADVASTLNNIAAIYFYRGLYSRTLHLFKMATDIQRQTGNAGELARSLNNLGCVYHEFGDFDRALDYLGESIILNRRIGSKKEMMFNLENLSSVMLSAGRLRDSLKFLKEGLQLSRELSDVPHIATFTCNMAVAQKRMGLYGQALDNVNEAIKLHDAINSNQHLLLCLIETADIHLRLNNFQSTAGFVTRIISLAESTDDKKALITGYLLKGQMEKNADIIKEAIARAREIKASRIENIGQLKLAKVLLTGGDYHGSRKVLISLQTIFKEGSSDIETAGYINLLGGCYLAESQIDNAKRFFTKGFNLAKDLALLPELIDSAFNLGKINAGLNAHEAVYDYYRLAIEKLKIIAADIKDDLLKKSFLSDGKIASMAEEIKRLSSLLTNK